MALFQSGSELMSLVPVTTKGHGDAWGLPHLLRLCWDLRALPPLGPCRSGWPTLPPGAMMMSGPELLPKVMSGSMSLQRLVAIEAHVAASDQVSHLSTCHLKRILSLGLIFLDISVVTLALFLLAFAWYASYF